MKVFSLIFYLFAIFLFYLGFSIADIRLDYHFFIHTYGITILFSGLLLTGVNFNFKEIIQSLKGLFNNTPDYKLIKNTQLIVNTVWLNIFNAGIVGVLSINIVLFSNPEKYSIGKYHVLSLDKNWN